MSNYRDSDIAYFASHDVNTARLIGRRVRVRCLRERGVWEITLFDNKHLTTEAILEDVTFEGVEETSYVGCGLTELNIVGYATGTLKAVGQGKASRNGASLRFDADTSCFRYGKQNRKLTKAHALHLMFGCKSRVQVHKKKRKVKVKLKDWLPPSEVEVETEVKQTVHVHRKG